MRRINYKSDIPPLLLSLKVDENQITVPDCDFIVRFYIEGYEGRHYDCSHIGGVWSNCEPSEDGTKLVCYINNQRLGIGELCAEFHYISPDRRYSDGSQKSVVIIDSTELGVELVEDNGDAVTEAAIDVTLPFIYRTAYEIARDHGYTGTAEDFYSALASVVGIADAEKKRVTAEITRNANEQERIENEENRLNAESERVNAEAQRVRNEAIRGNAESDRVEQEEDRKAKFEEITGFIATVRANEGNRESNEQERQTNEDKRITEEAKRVEAEKKRAAEFEQQKLDLTGKIDSSGDEMGGDLTFTDNAGVSFRTSDGGTHTMFNDTDDVAKFTADNGDTFEFKQNETPNKNSSAVVVSENLYNALDMTLDSMGSALDGDAAYRAEAGDKIFNPDTCKIQRYNSTVGGFEDLCDPIEGKLYVNKMTDYIYRWNTKANKMVFVGGVKAYTKDEADSRFAKLDDATQTVKVKELDANNSVTAKSMWIGDEGLLLGGDGNGHLTVEQDEVITDVTLNNKLATKADDVAYGVEWNNGQPTGEMQETTVKEATRNTTVAALFLAQSCIGLEQEVEKKADKTELDSYATKEYVQTNAPQETKASIEEKLGAWLEDDGGESDGEVYTKAESDALFSGKISKTDITQSTGTSETAVMSQKAITDLFYNVSEYIGIPEQISFELRNGFINGYDGSVDYGYTLRLVTTDFINCKSIRIINSGSVCKYNVAAYSDTGYIGESKWKTETNTYKFPNANKYKLVFAFTNDAAITPSDFDSLGISVINGANGNVIHSDKSQSLSDSEKQIARSNINAASATDVDNISNELNVITNQLRPDVGSFYKNGWIRYSDGEFNYSSGGAKTYIIKKTDLQSDSTKFFIKTNTESNIFAAVAFYSTEEPSTDSYLKDISVQGINDTTASHVYEVEIPESGWVSAFVLYMSQYSTDFYIKTNGDIVIVFQEDLDNACEQTLQKSKESAIDLVSPLFNPFALKPFYHHMNQEVNKPAVPGQSLQDIAYAKALGFDMIEANVMKTSDGVHVTKHGEGGKLGNGIKSVDGQDYSDTLFSDVTSAWLRENITYDSLFSKNNTFIPTLAEFCSECKRLSMKVKLGNYSQGALDVARKYLPDDMIFAGSESNRNSGFRGLIERVWSPTESIDDKIQECKNIKAPINIVISAGTFTQCTDEQLLELSEKAHQAGFTTSMVYPTTSDAIRALKFGIDAICSTNGSCNILYHGNAENVSDIDDNALVITGGSYDESTNTITLPAGATIKLDAANAYRFGLCSIRTIYRGKLSFALGGVNVLSDYESDGVQPVAFCNVIQPDNSSSKKYNWCVITAVEDTVINDLKINCSII